MNSKIGISGKLVLILLTAGILLLVTAGFFQYRIEVGNTDEKLKKEAEAILSRLSINLAQQVYDFNIKGISSVVKSEFHNPNVAGVIVRDISEGEMLFEYGRLQGEKSVKAESERFFRVRKAISILDFEGLHQKKIDIASVDLFMDRQPLQEAVFYSSAGAILKFAIIILCLICILSVTIQRFLVKPLEIIRAGMEKAIEWNIRPDSYDAIQKPVKLNPEAKNKGFLEIRRMAECFENMSLAISERQNEIAKSRESLRITLDSIGDAVVSTDIKGLVQMMNPVAEKITGWSGARSLNTNISDVLVIIERRTRKPIENPAITAMSLSGIVPFPQDAMIISPEGDELDVSGICSPIRGRDGSVLGAVLVFRDITQAKKIEEQLHQARKMDVIGQLAGGVAHDFNNMLGGIIGNAELLSFSLPADSHLRQYADTIINGAERAADLTKKLLAFSRKAKIVSTPVDIHEQIRAAIALLERSIDPRIRIIVRFEATSSMVASDPSLIQNAFLNLAINSRDAMPDGGTLTFATCNILLDYDFCKKLPYRIEPGMYLEISISDTGIGMTKDVLSRVFEPFFTTKPVGQGTGLGLSAVYGTVKDHQGTINAYSEPGLGTVFKIYLPVDTSGHEGISGSVPEMISGKGGCILVVDDEDIIRTTAHALLSSLGYEVLMAEGGDEALKIFMMEKERISAVILDIVMPVMNGREVYQHLRELDSDVPIIFSSGFSSDGVVSDLMDMGAAAFIQKPYRQSSLAKTLDEVLSA